MTLRSHITARVALPVGFLIAVTAASLGQPIDTPELDNAVTPPVLTVTSPAPAAKMVQAAKPIHPVAHKPVAARLNKGRVQPVTIQVVRLASMSDPGFYGPPMWVPAAAEANRNGRRERLAWQRPGCVSMACPNYVLMGIGY